MEQMIVETPTLFRDRDGNKWEVIQRCTYNDRPYVIVRCPLTAALRVFWVDTLPVYEVCGYRPH